MIYGKNVATAVGTSIDKISDLRHRMNELQTSLVNGRKNLSQISSYRDRESSYSLRYVISESEAYLHNVRLIKSAIPSFDAALVNVDQIVDSMFNEFVERMSGIHTRNDRRDHLSAIFDRLVEALSLTVPGSSIFSGSDSGNPPLERYFRQPTSLARQMVLNDLEEFKNISDQSMSPFHQNRNVLINLAEFLKENSMSANGWKEYWQLTPSVRNSVRIDSQRSITSINIDDLPHLRPMLSKIVVAIEMDPSEIPNDTWTEFYRSVINDISIFKRDIINLRSEIGHISSILEDASNRHSHRIEHSNSSLNNIEQIDVYKSAAMLVDYQNILELSLRSTALSKNMYLLKFL